MILSRVKGFYHDTDSFKIDEESFKQWCEFAKKEPMVKHVWDTTVEADKRYKDAYLYNDGFKVFGSFEDEYKGCGFDLHYFLDKKEYMSINTKTKKYKMSFKGVSKKNIVARKLPTYKSTIDGVKTVVKPYELTKKSGEKIVIHANDQQHLIDIFAKNNVSDFMTVDDDPIGFFERLYNEREISAIGILFKKNLRNSKRPETTDDTNKMNDKAVTIQILPIVKDIILSSKRLENTRLTAEDNSIKSIRNLFL